MKRQSLTTRSSFSFVRIQEIPILLGNNNSLYSLKNWSFVANGIARGNFSLWNYNIFIMEKVTTWTKQFICTCIICSGITFNINLQIMRQTSKMHERLNKNVKEQKPDYTTTNWKLFVEQNNESCRRKTSLGRS